MKKVLVTGGLGFVGSNLVDRLHSIGGYDITVIDNLSSQSSNINYKTDYAEYIIDDINNLDNIKYKDLNFDIIFHLAGLARIQPSFADPIPYFKANVLGTVSVCELAKRCNARVVYAASSSAEAGPKLNPYSFTKWSGEELLKMYSEVYGLSTVSTRFFNVYGDRQPTKGTYATLIGIFERQYANGEPLTITGTGEQRRDFTHVYDINDGMICLSHDNHSGEIYNLGTGVNYSVNEIAAMFDTETKYIPKRLGEAMVTLADTSAAAKYGYSPKQSIKKYIKNFEQSFFQIL